MWVRGLKLADVSLKYAQGQSHPMWVRGLKPVSTLDMCETVMSHPMWVRGLKLTLSLPFWLHSAVAPYVGAWIETDTIYNIERRFRSHPMWVRGLKRWARVAAAPLACRTLCGCVD